MLRRATESIWSYQLYVIFPNFRFFGDKYIEGPSTSIKTDEFRESLLPHFSRGNSNIILSIHLSRYHDANWLFIPIDAIYF